MASFFSFLFSDEVPSQKNAADIRAGLNQATLHYFGGRGLSDQIRWMLAASDVVFTQQVINTRAKFLSLLNAQQLAFDQMPLLEIDGLKLVQSQACVRYLARRSNLNGQSTAEEATCDMIAESVRDVLGFLSGFPFKRKAAKTDPASNESALTAHITAAREKWHKLAVKLEARLVENNKTNSDDTSPNLVGESMTYADILTAHLVTWLIEEIGSSCIESYPALLKLQQKIVKLPGMVQFLGSDLHYPCGDVAYCDEVSEVLGRKIG